jgi:hypothetical protein
MRLFISATFYISDCLLILAASVSVFLESSEMQRDVNIHSVALREQYCYLFPMYFLSKYNLYINEICR